MRTAWLRVTGLALLMTALQAAGPATVHALRYDRTAILGGQLWRLLTGHLVHLGWVHYALNTVGVCLCLLLAPALFRGRWWWLQLMMLALGISLLLLVFEPRLPNYAGLSGVVYGLLMLGLAPQARADKFVAVCLVALLAWMGWQLLVGPAAAEEKMIGGRIVGTAHLFGVMIAGAMLVLGACRNR